MTYLEGFSYWNTGMGAQVPETQKKELMDMFLQVNPKKSFFQVRKHALAILSHSKTRKVDLPGI